MIMNILAAVLYIVVGALLLVVPEMKMIYLAYALCLALAVCGVVQIVTYFTREKYKKLSEYGFSAGVLLLVLGGCVLVKAQTVAEVMLLWLGLCMLLTSVVLLQNAMQLKILGSVSWIGILAAAVLFIVCAMLMIAEPAFLRNSMREFAGWMLLLHGVMSPVGMLLVKICMLQSEKREQKANARAGAETEEKQEEKEGEITGTDVEEGEEGRGQEWQI